MRERLGAWGPGSQGAWGLGPGAQAVGAQAIDWDPPLLGCKGEKKRVFTLSVTETIQHAPQGWRMT